jgi:predicted transcriptional regulator
LNNGAIAAMNQSTNQTIDWVAQYARYETERISKQELADELGVSVSTVKRHLQGAKKATKELNQKVNQQIKNQLINDKAKQILSDLEMIDSVIRICFDAWKGLEFKTAEGAIAALDKMLRLKLEYSDERIQEWLFRRGYIAIPIPELEQVATDREKRQNFDDVIDREPREPILS